MLIGFSVENYRNFKDKVTLNFENVHDYEYNKQCIKNGLLSKAIIYGANASGKSNFGFALFDIVGLLTDKNTHYCQNDEILIQMLQHSNMSSKTRKIQLHICIRKKALKLLLMKN